MKVEASALEINILDMKDPKGVRTPKDENVGSWKLPRENALKARRPLWNALRDRRPLWNALRARRPFW